MVTKLEELILDNFKKLTLALQQDQRREAEKIFAKNQSLISTMPNDAYLFGEYLLFSDRVLECDYDLDSVAYAYNQMHFEFNKQKYPEKFKDS